MTYTRGIGAGASEDRLDKLIEERLLPGADKEAIDARIWDLFGEEWAVMFTDLSGFSRRVAAFGIIHFLQIIHEFQRVLVPLIDGYDGILLKSEGDSLMVIFRTPAKAVSCAVRMQTAVAAYNRGKPDTETILLCVGIGYGRMLRIGDHDVYGAEVNAAAKLGEDTARAWEILVTGAVWKAMEGSPGLRGEALPEAPSGADSAFRVLYSRRTRRT